MDAGCDCQNGDAPPSLPSNINPLMNLACDELSAAQTNPSNEAKKPEKDTHDDEGDETESVRREVFLPYAHKEWVKGCVAHPGNIVEPASLAVINCEINEDYDLISSLPEAAIKEGKLSSLQLESIIKAAHRHRILLPNGERAGFFIGDAAGVGKGRQIAGVIMDNFCRGRKRHVWFSVSNDLIIDAKRDLTDIGCHINVIDGCKAIDKGTKLFGLCDSVRSGVVFSTYSTLVSTVLSGAMNSVRRTRLQQLIDWCGGDNFDGCLVFDECHKAKNFTPGAENTGSKVALAVCEIQRALPKARVLYCSATGVTDTRNMAFMGRLGLWGLSSPFKSYEHFLETVQKKGLGLAEMLAMDMKREGLYVSRMLSFADAQFYNVEYKLTDRQRLIYNMSAHIWNEVRKSLAYAINQCHTTKSVSRMYWSQHQKFFQQLCISMKVDEVVKEANKALAEGMCVVIGLQNTGEANTEGKIVRDGAVDGFVSSCREILINFLNNHFPVEIETQLPQGQPAVCKRYDSWSIQARSMLLQYAQQLELPGSALDILIDKLGGPKRVAEMTGRRGRIVRYDPKAKPKYELRHTGCISDQTVNVTEREKFMSGEKLIAIISDAASTGISLHSDRNCKNQRQRAHITLQLPWSADKAVQQLGRSHRSNQISGPIYKLVTTELGGERRFAASVAKRLQSLGALTKGDRRAATVADLSQFNYDTVYGKSALKLMYTKIIAGEIPETVPLELLTFGHFSKEQFLSHMKTCITTMGLLTEFELEKKLPVADSDSRDVSRFLNRILGLQIVLQNLIFNYFLRCLEVTVNIAKKEGKFNEGFVDLTGSSMMREGQPKHVFKDLTNDSRQVHLLVDRGMPWIDAQKRYMTLKGDDPVAGFYKTRNQMYNRYFYLLITPKEGSNHFYKIARPNTGVNIQELDSDEVRMKYEKISLERAEMEWSYMYEDSLVRCNHGSSCYNPHYCQVGMRRYRVNLICGSLLRILPILEQSLNKNAMRMKLSKYESSVKVVRVCLDDGERLIGLQYPEIMMSLAESEAKAMATEKQLSAFSELKEIIEPVTPVQPKLFKRASEPPKTILSYFTKIKDKTSIENNVNTTPQPSQTSSRKVEVKEDGDDDDDIICILDTTPNRVNKRRSKRITGGCTKKRLKKSE